MAESSRYVLDLAALHAAVTAVVRHRQITMREVAAETGMSPSTLTRIGQGHAPDADGPHDALHLYLQLHLRHR